MTTKVLTSNLSRRLKKLEARLTDSTGLALHSEAWFSYWESRLERMGTGEDVDLRGITLDVVDSLRARYADQEAEGPTLYEDRH